MSPNPPSLQGKGSPTRNKIITALFVGAVIGVAATLLWFIVYGILHMSQPVQGNRLTGTIVEKKFTPLKEQMVEFSGRAIQGVKESEGEHVLKVRVDSEQGRVFEVPVEKSLYDAKKVGETLTFMRPPSEQR